MGKAGFQLGTNTSVVSASAPKRSELQISDLCNLVLSTDYRTFVKTYLQMKNLNFSDFSRSANCTRAFTNQVLSSKRRLTAKSVYTFENAFKLPLNAKKIFRLLVAKEEADLFPEMDRSNLENQIVKLQMSIESKSRKDFSEADFVKIDKDLEITHQAISIFAASGDHNSGSTLEELYQRTRLAENVLIKNIDLLIKMNLLEKRQDRYFPVNLHVYLQTKSKSELLNIVFKTAINSTASRLGHITEDSNEFFFASQFCINESQMPALKRELRESILKFVDESLVSNGDRVVKVLTALHL
jgi:hypothetical protein